MMNMSPEASIGLLKEKFKELKTKDLVDLAGLSLQQPQLKPNALLPAIDSQEFPNNNSSIVTQDVKDVQEVGIIMLCIIWKREESVPKLVTNTQPDKDPVN